MKNVAIGILVLLVIVTGYVAVESKFRMRIKGLEGETETIIRGDLTIPINATGEVSPARRVEIKSEASGEVIEIAKQPGDRVRQGDLLIRLEQVDEERTVNRAKLDVKAAEARLEVTRINLKKAETADLTVAQARVDQLRESVRLAKFRLDKIRALDAAQTNEEEVLQRETTLGTQQAQLKEAQGGYQRAELAIPLAEQEVKQAESSYDRAKNILADAEKVLAETAIIAPIDGIVGDVFVEVGDVIQGGKTTLTGGTILASVLDMDRLTVGAEVDESDIERVRKIAPRWAIPGHDESEQMPADLDEAASQMERLPVITVESFRDQDFKGVIERINPEPRMMSGVVTYTVDVIIISKSRSLLLPGMRADVRFTSEHLENVLLCPNEAIREGTNGRLGVHVPSGDETRKNRTVFVQCNFGLSNGNYSQVLCDDLHQGNMVYTRLPAKADR